MKFFIANRYSPQPRRWSIDIYQTEKNPDVVYADECEESKNCAFCKGNDISTCTRCFQFENRVVKDGACVCDKGFVETDGSTICATVEKYEKGSYETVNMKRYKSRSYELITNRHIDFN